MLQKKRCSYCKKYNAIDEVITRNIFGNKCFVCKSEHDLTIDHHMPLSLGFALSVENAVVMCRSCNSSKGTNLPGDFYSTEELNEINILFKRAKYTKRSANK